MGDTRQDFKMEFLEDFTKYILNLRRERPNLIISGDYNICNKPIDINYPEKHQKSSGFLPEERSWFDAFIDHGFVDTFRVFNQQSEGKKPGLENRLSPGFRSHEKKFKKCSNFAQSRTFRSLPGCR
jgi:hypothetical protein